MDHPMTTSLDADTLVRVYRDARTLDLGPPGESHETGLLAVRDHVVREDRAALRVALGERDTEATEIYDRACRYVDAARSADAPVTEEERRSAKERLGPRLYTWADEMRAMVADATKTSDASSPALPPSAQSRGPAVGTGVREQVARVMCSADAGSDDLDEIDEPTRETFLVMADAVLAYLAPRLTSAEAQKAAVEAYSTGIAGPDDIRRVLAAAARVAFGEVALPGDDPNETVPLAVYDDACEERDSLRGSLAKAESEAADLRRAVEAARRQSDEARLALDCGTQVTLAEAAANVVRERDAARAERDAVAEARGYLAQCDDLKVYVADVVDEIDRLAKEQANGS